MRNGAGSLQSNGDDPGDAAQEGQASSLILDELDSGVGGRLGMPVGRLLQRMVSSGAQGLSQIHQVLCVSHLPQVWHIEECIYLPIFLTANVDSLICFPVTGTACLLFVMFV